MKRKLTEFMVTKPDKKLGKRIDKREIIDQTEIENIRESDGLFQESVARGYTKSYVKGLEDELVKLTKENVYLRSDDYLDDVISRDYIQELQDKNNEILNESNKLLNENLYLKSDQYHDEIRANFLKEKELMNQKIGLLSLLGRRLASESLDREDILATLKKILH